MKTIRIKMKVTKVTETEVEFEDGTVTPHLVPFEKDEVPSVEEFQETYDNFLSKIEVPNE